MAVLANRCDAEDGCAFELLLSPSVAHVFKRRLSLVRSPPLASTDPAFLPRFFLVSPSAALSISRFFERVASAEAVGPAIVPQNLNFGAKPRISFLNILRHQLTVKRQKDSKNTSFLHHKEAFWNAIVNLPRALFANYPMPRGRPNYV